MMIALGRNLLYFIAFSSFYSWVVAPLSSLKLPLQYSWASLVDHLVKNLPARQETWVQTLGWKDPLEKGKATHSSILAWRIPRTA